MRHVGLIGITTTILVVLLSGCATQTQTHTTPPTGGTQSTNQLANASAAETSPTNSSQSSSRSNPWPDVNWVLTDALMKQKKWMTEYNQTLSINQGVYGQTSQYDGWELPPKWSPYLYKNEHWVHPKSGPMYLNHQTLFITLQGTVFLKSGVGMRFWPPLSAMDIPPDATIVAEFVPLIPAVKAGIIPVYQSQPQVDSAEPNVLKVLGMTRKEYASDIGNLKGN